MKIITIMKQNILLVILGLLFFTNIIGQEALKNETKINNELVTVLDSIHFYDQKYREKLNIIEEQFGSNSKELNALWDTINWVDSINVIKVTEIIDNYGWLGKSVIGEVGNKTLFLVIQHADTETQLKYIPVMREAVKLGNAEASHYAYLEDRVLLAQGKKQIYGTQLLYKNSTNELSLEPIEDPDNIDIRRAEVGLGPISEYLKQWNLTWDVEQYKIQNK